MRRRLGTLIRHKSGQSFTHTNFPDRARVKCVNSFCDINVHKLLMLRCHVFDGTHSRELLPLSGNFQDCPEIFQTVLKLFTMLEIFQTRWKLSRLCGNFPNCVETFHTVLKFSRLAGNFQGSTGSFQTVWYILSLMFMFRL